jgi:type I restriction enzyme S subunit
MVSQVEDVPTGFKLTELGPLPKEWHVNSIKDVAEFTHKPRNLNIAESDTIPFISMECISSDGSGHCIYHEKLASEISSGVYCELGDILIAKITPCLENGKQCIVNDNLPTSFAYATTEVYPLKPHREIIDRSFLFAYLIYPPIRQELAAKMEGTTGRQRLAKHVLESLCLPIPPLPEQRAIAHVLSTIQRAIEAQDKVISAVRELKKSLMHHLFTYGPVPVSEVDRVTLKETEIGSLPESWKIVCLGDVVKEKITDGVHKTPSYVEFGVPFIMAKDIVNNRIDFTNSRNIPSAEHQVLTKRVKPEKGDILLTKVGTVGNLALVDTEAPFSIFVQIALIKPDNGKVDSTFLKYVLLTANIQDDIIKNASQSTMKFIGTQKIAQVAIPLPMLKEQCEIAFRLSSIDAKIQAEENHRSALQTLFKTMLHLLMTGSLRVKDLQIGN